MGFFRNTVSGSIDRRMTMDSGLFDATWYRLANPSIVHENIEPLTHFLKKGRELRLSPSRKFDLARYLDEYELVRRSSLNPLVHFLKHGRALGLTAHPAPPSDAERIRDSGFFDEEWYLSQYKDVDDANYPALLHYMVHGADERRSPGPDFDTQWYLTRYPDIVGMNPVLHYVDFGRKEGRLPTRPTRLISVAQSTVSGVEDLEPDLYGSDLFENLDNVLIVDGLRRHRVAQALKTVAAKISDAPRAIVFLPWLMHGGADLVACHLIRAMADRCGAKSVLVILTDEDREDALHLLPSEVAYISFSKIDFDLSPDERVDLVSHLVRNLEPNVTLNVNSHACWEAIKRHGKLLQHCTRLYAMLFCPDFSASGRKAGYSDTYLRSCLPYLEAIYFDNRSYIDELIEQFGVPSQLQERLVCVYQPAPDISRKGRSNRNGGKLNVLWAGRFSAQKNVDLLIRIAEAASDFSFHVWGRGDPVLEARLKELARRCEHVHLHGPYDRFDQLPLEDYDALLYTSLWDGIPNILLEAASADLPIVASRIGGIGELVNAQTGWLIDDTDDPKPYMSALSEIAANEKLARSRVVAMRGHLQRNHNWTRYLSVVTDQPVASGGILSAISAL